MNICEAEVTPLIFVGEALVIDSKEMQNCRMKVVNVDWVLRDIVTVIVRGPVGSSWLAPAAYTTTGHRIMVDRSALAHALAGATASGIAMALFYPLDQLRVHEQLASSELSP